MKLTLAEGAGAKAAALEAKARIQAAENFMVKIVFEAMSARKALVVVQSRRSTHVVSGRKSKLQTQGYVSGYYTSHQLEFEFLRSSGLRLESFCMRFLFQLLLQR